MVRGGPICSRCHCNSPCSPSNRDVSRTFNRWDLNSVFSPLDPPPCPYRPSPNRRPLHCRPAYRTVQATIPPHSTIPRSPSPNRQDPSIPLLRFMASFRLRVLSPWRGHRTGLGLLISRGGGFRYVQPLRWERDEMTISMDPKKTHLF